MASIPTPRANVNAFRVAPCLFPGGTLAQRRSQQTDDEKLAAQTPKAAGGPCEALYRLWLFDDQLGWYAAPGDPKVLQEWTELEYCLDGVYAFLPATAAPTEPTGTRDNVTLSRVAPPQGRNYRLTGLPVSWRVRDCYPPRSLASDKARRRATV